MARLVATFGSSHSIMLVAQLQEWIHNFRLSDPTMPFFGREGEKLTFAQVLEAAPKDVRELITEEAITRRFNETQAAMDRMRQEITAAKLDVLVVVGDDQRELFHDWHMPAMGIYYGDTIRNAAKPVPLPDDWYKRAATQRLEDGAPVDYPCDRAFALHLIEGLIDNEFDVSAVSNLREGEFEGHAFSFIHRRYLPGNPVRMIPVFLNTYNAPNPPPPRRCVKLGQALAKLIEAYPVDCRVGLLASGGLSHFAVDEPLDRAVMQAVRDKDLDYLAALEPKRLKAGSSEIRCWAVMAGAAGQMDVQWDAYVPAYRTEALTGTGLGFVSLR